jgi:ABC-2 type transport system permease protein
MGRIMEAQGIDYVQYLTPAIVVQAMLFAAISSAYYVGEDAATGMLGRARTLPHSRQAPVLGRAGADSVRALVGLVVLIGLGSIFGFRYEGGALAVLAFWALAVAIAVTLSLGTGLVGLAQGDPQATLETLNLPYLPLLMLSTAFVPADGFPSWLEGLVAHQPVSRFVDALRALASDDPFGAPLAWALGWVVVLGAVFGVMSVRAHARAR